MHGGGFVAEFYHVVAFGHGHGAQDVVGSEVFNGLSVKVGFPVGGIVYLAEHGQLRGVAMGVVGEGVQVGGVFVLHLDGGGAVF